MGQGESAVSLLQHREHCLASQCPAQTLNHWPVAFIADMQRQGRAWMQQCIRQSREKSIDHSCRRNHMNAKTTLKAPAQPCVVASQDTPEGLALSVHITVQTDVPVFEEQRVHAAKPPCPICVAHRYIRTADRQESDRADPVQHGPVEIAASHVHH